MNNVVPLPFKGIWNRSYFTCPFKNKKPICFVLFRDWVSLDKYTGYINWLKNKYTGSKFVWFLHDLIAYHNDFYTGQVLDIDMYKQKMDMVITCNPTEALQYGLHYHRVPIFKLYKEKKSNRCNVLFIGQDKGRLDRLLRIYKVLTRKGARCRFFISEASVRTIDSDMKEVVLLDSPMSYKQCQEWVSESNCLLELRFDSHAGETLRASEALLYGKKLITDNSSLADSDYFDANRIRILSSDDDAEQIDLPFLTNHLEVSHDKMEAYRKHLSPLAFLEELDATL